MLYNPSFLMFSSGSDGDNSGSISYRIWCMLPLPTVSAKLSPRLWMLWNSFESTFALIYEPFGKLKPYSISSLNSLNSASPLR